MDKFTERRWQQISSDEATLATDELLVDVDQNGEHE